MLSTTTYKLTPEMKRALEMLKTHGELIRYKGGFWSYEGATMAVMGIRNRDETDFVYPVEHVGLQTLEALERRDMIEVSETKAGWGRPYAVKYKLKK